MIILGKVRNEIQKFETERVRVVSGYDFNQRETLNKIELYYNSKFETGDKDSEGFKKFFYNIVHFPCQVAMKSIDLDTKDFHLVPDTAEATVPTLFLQKEMKDWMTENGFDKVLNQVSANLPKYGSVVLKKVGDEVEFVSLHNLVNEQDVEDLDDGYVIERHIMSPTELREMKGWDKDAVERVIKLYEDSKETRIVVWERWGWVKASDVDPSEGDEAIYCVVISAGIEKVKKDDQSKKMFEQGEILFWEEADEDKDFPYYECHWEKIPGRWLGVGMVEKNFDAQVRMNELENIKSKALYLSSKILLQTQDDTVAKNILSDLGNGDILRVKSPVQQIPMQLNDLGAFAQEESRWDKNVQESSFSFEVETGESLPSGTPFRLGALQKQASQGFFNFKRENIGIFYKDLFMDVIIPHFKKSKRKKHNLTIPKDDKDMEQLMSKYIDFLIYAKVQDYAQKTGFMPTLMDIQAERVRLENDVAKRKNIFVEVPDSFYDEAKFSMSLIITDEQVDVAQKLETVSNLVQLVGSNPAILQDPNTRSLIFAAMNLAGVSPVELGIDTTRPMPQLPQAEMPQMQGQQMQGPQSVQQSQQV